MTIWYVDTSAALKLIFDEPESGAARRWWRRHRSTTASSWILETEVKRAVRRIGVAAGATSAGDILAEVELVRPTRSIRRAAATVDPPALRSLDALHLATALALSHDLAGMVVYDRRLAAAARSAGVRVVAPT